MEYILGKKPEHCILCAMTQEGHLEKGDAHVLALLPDVLVCLNKFPFSAGHLLVAPRRHVGDVLELPQAEYVALMHVFKESATRLRRAVRATGLNLGFNVGADAGAGIEEHAHGHIVPRWHGDTNFMPVLADVRVMPQHLDETYRHLAPFFSDLTQVPA
jgi:ATP adenylyltransferase